LGGLVDEIARLDELIHGRLCDDLDHRAKVSKGVRIYVMFPLTQKS
jgi:hypothetical protein